MRNSPAETRVSEEEGGGGLPGARADVSSMHTQLFTAKEKEPYQ